MVGWHQQLNEHGFGWTPGVGDGQAGLACCGSWGLKESDMTERLNCTETVACQAPLSMGFCRQEYWSGLPCLPPGDLPIPEIIPTSAALQVGSLPTELHICPRMLIK